MRSKDWAVFLDRDGVLNELVYYAEEGRVGSPLSAKQLKVTSHASETVNGLHDLGARIITISNQPGVAKEQFSYLELCKMNEKIRKDLSKKGAAIDWEYYCLHHPDATIQKYRKVCSCRKPKPGLLVKAAKDHNVDLKDSFFVGDSLIDVKAGRAAGVRTVLVGTMTDLLNRVIEEEDARPDYLVSKFSNVVNCVKKIRSKYS